MKRHSLVVAISFALALVVVLSIIQLRGVLANNSGRQDNLRVSLHPPVGTPVALLNYRLPFDRNSISVITDGPYEGMHTGKSNEAIDFSPKGGWSEVYAGKAGTVYLNRNYGDWGNLVVVCHESDGFCTYYAHLQNPGPVGEKTSVTQGQRIGNVGNTGCDDATPPCGVHLHWEARDGMTPTPTPTGILNANAAYGGDSTRHSLRRVRGIGWYPWYPNPSNSGFTIRAVPPHAVQQCSSEAIIRMQLPSHAQLAHTQSEKYSIEITLNQKNYAPPTTINLQHATSEATRTFTAQVDPQKYWIHARAFDATNNEWARDDEVAHQGPYKLGSQCDANLPPGYKDNIPESGEDP